MAYRKGFTLIEIIVVLIIVGILAAVAIPSYVNSVEQSRAQTAQNNLMTIDVAQEKFNEDYNSYCISTGTNPTGLTASCGDTISDLSANLRFTTSTSDAFVYSCSNASAPYVCTATDGTDTLTLSPNNANLNPPTSVITCTPSSSCPSNLQ